MPLYYHDSVYNNYILFLFSPLFHTNLSNLSPSRSSPSLSRLSSPLCCSLSLSNLSDRLSLSAPTLFPATSIQSTPLPRFPANAAAFARRHSPTSLCLSLSLISLIPSLFSCCVFRWVMAAVVGVCITSVCIICVRRECVLVRVCILYESCECYQGVCVFAEC